MTNPRKRGPTPRWRYADEGDLSGLPLRDLRQLDKSIATLDDYEHLVKLDGCCGVCGGSEPEDELECEIQESWAREGLVLIDGQLVPEDDGRTDWWEDEP